MKKTKFDHENENLFEAVGISQKRYKKLGRDVVETLTEYVVSEMTKSELVESLIELCETEAEIFLVSEISTKLLDSIGEGLESCGNEDCPIHGKKRKKSKVKIVVEGDGKIPGFLKRMFDLE